ncbi:heme NO-binding domain-containing protein [Roseovarius sp. C7]|uniref:heme NO-binding domain-containing protein n=1 Tax=Roseovarius sp. C7 TaxID=3398643 RepID=UPI0039F64FAF
MHGLINRAIERFIRDTYGREVWGLVVAKAGLPVSAFEAMLSYETHLTVDLLDGAEQVLDRARETILEDIGTYLVSHSKLDPLRRLLRFGGVDFVEFLHSLDELPGRARLAVPDLEIPNLELGEHGGNIYRLRCDVPTAAGPGFGHVLVGVLRAMADDYGALVLLDHMGGGPDVEILQIQLLNEAHSAGKMFDLAAGHGAETAEGRPE